MTTKADSGRTAADRQPPIPPELLREVVMTKALHSRPAKQPNFEAQCAALLQVARTIAATPGEVLNVVAQVGMHLTGAGSAGVSVLDETDAGPVFRWRGLAGQFAALTSVTLPRHFSPCGIVLDVHDTILMTEPVRIFPYIAELTSPVREVLLVPFERGDVPVGTVWVVAHQADKQFDSEDARIVKALAQFASTAVRIADMRSDADISAAENVKLNAAMLEASRHKDMFLAVLGHELRNPLSAIALALHALQRQAEGMGLTIPARDLIDRQVQHMVRLVNELLDVTRVTTGKLELRKGCIPIREVLVAAIELSQAQLNAHAQTVSLDLVAEPKVVADPHRLAQVFSNLLTNATKFSTGPGEITLSGGTENGFVVVRVRDHGMGIPHDRLESIFNMFAQVAPESVGREGLGIGLALARQIVQMHGGTIRAASEGPGKGSEFTVSLPVANHVTSTEAEQPDAPSRY